MFFVMQLLFETNLKSTYLILPLFFTYTGSLINTPTVCGVHQMVWKRVS